MVNLHEKKKKKIETEGSTVVTGMKIRDKLCYNIALYRSSSQSLLNLAPLVLTNCYQLLMKFTTLLMTDLK